MAVFICEDERGSDNMNNSSLRNHPDNAGIKVPPPLIFAVPFATGLLLQHFFPVVILPATVKVIPALICVVTSAILGIWSLAWFVRSHTNPMPTKPSTIVVTSGPYRFSRNPMYVSLALLYIGLGFGLDIFWALILMPLVVITIRYYVIAREERYLERKFGVEYLRYKKSVRRWI